MNSKAGVFGKAQPGAPKLLFLVPILIAALLMDTRGGSAQTFQNQTPPQSNTTSSGSQPSNPDAPGKTAAGKTQYVHTAPNKSYTTGTGRSITQPKAHQGGKQYSHGQSRGGGVGFGVGATIDLSGIGQRRPEPNPFAVQPARRPVTARTEVKPPPTKKSREVTKTDPFANVQLTGEQAKEENNPP